MRLRLLVAVLGLAAAACEWPIWGVNPCTIMEKFFSTPSPDRAESLIGAGSSGGQGHDAWVRFYFKGAVLLKDRDRYADADAAQFREAFVNVLPQDHAILRSTTLKALALTDPRLGYSNGRVLLYDAERGYYCFRSWSHR